MDLEPKKFFIGVIDFFSVLLPGALLTYQFMDDPLFLEARYHHLTGTAAWLAFLFGSYIFGHFIFLLGAALLDDFLYEPIRDATSGKQIERLASGKVPSPIITRILARLLIKKDSDEVQTRAIKIKEHYTNPLGPLENLQTGIRCRAWQHPISGLGALEVYRPAAEGREPMLLVRHNVGGCEPKRLSAAAG